MGSIKSSVCQNIGFKGTLTIRANFGLFFGLPEPNLGPDGGHGILANNDNNTLNPLLNTSCPEKMRKSENF